MVHVLNIDCKRSGKKQSEIIFNEFKKHENWQTFSTEYSEKFVSEKKNVLLSNEILSTKIFIATNKIKKDISEQGIYFEKLSANDIYFFDKYPKEGLFENCFLIDLTNAYPTALFNMGVIKKETFDYINTLKKIDKLRAIGSLATRKIIREYEFDKLKSINQEAIKNEGFAYFYAAHKIGEVMQAAERKAKETHLFTWFDGIYLKSKEHATEIIKEINNLGFNCKLSELIYFKSEKTKRNILVKWHEKEKKEKSINIPLPLNLKK